MSETVPEYYGDVFYLRSSPWGVALTLTASSPKENIYEHDVCVVRLSHETAKTLSMVMRKHLKHYEEDTKTSITIPDKVMSNLGLNEEDW